jgi:hypothetical protein
MVELPLRMSLRITRELIGLHQGRADGVEALSRNERQTLPLGLDPLEKSERVSHILICLLDQKLMCQVPEERPLWVKLVRLLNDLKGRS